MTFGVDTSVVVRLLTGLPETSCAKAKARLMDAHHAREVVIVSDLVVAEAFYALKHHYGQEPEAIRGRLLDMLTSGLVQPEPGSAALAVLRGRTGGKAGFVDRLIASRYHADGVTTLTLDRHQAKLPQSEYIG